MTWAQLDQHAKPVMILNVNGFWDSLVALFRRMAEEGFLNKSFLGSHNDLPVEIVGSVEEVIPRLSARLAAVPRRELDQPVDVRF
jgi:predicted Rossmann-fold nucleotide-binding protein